MGKKENLVHILRKKKRKLNLTKKVEINMIKEILNMPIIDGILKKKKKKK